MLQPKRTKFRKLHKGRIRGFAKGGSDLNFGTYGLKATTPERVTARQIEAARRAMTTNRGRPTCYDTSHETAGSGLDSDFSGYTGYFQAC